MTFDLTSAGLILIVLGWAMQFYYSRFRYLSVLSFKFVILYVVGAALISWNSYQQGHFIVSIAYAITAVLALGAGYFARKFR